VISKNLVKQAMLEDLKPSGDITTKLIKKNKKAKAKIISNQNCIVGGLEFAKEAFKYSDKKVIFKLNSKDGKKIKKGKVVAIVYGNAKEILKSERVALNFLSLISGVASITNKFVNKVKGKSCKICCTRKTSPNLRSIQKYGVKLGGGLNHRFNLSDEILIKDNHIVLDGDIRKLVTRAIKNKNGKKITVEVDSINQLRKIIGLKFDRVLFDNMSAKNILKGIKLSNKLYETEASGGISLKNVKKIASTGVNRISVGQITHSAPSIDFKLDLY
jgi:nicotinate-nucleotide pyrophosphorylase (carboxylating)|tara:strand:- start:738 stop:1556 length:819 start_codon:yes stop_codon:yes gene_type:complete